MNLGAAEIGLIMLAVMVLFGYRKLPDAARSLGQSLQIFKNEVHELHLKTPASPSSPQDGSVASSDGDRS